MSKKHFVAMKHLDGAELHALLVRDHEVRVNLSLKGDRVTVSCPNQIFLYSYELMNGNIIINISAYINNKLVDLHTVKAEDGPAVLSLWCYLMAMNVHIRRQWEGDRAEA